MPFQKWNEKPEPGSNMTESKLPKALAQKIFTAVFTAMVIGGLASTLWSAEPESGALPPKTNSVEQKAKAPAAKRAAAKKQLTGAELYSMHCNRCHPERYPTERTAAQWKTLMLHMQVRANLPAEQARLILKYLQENSGR